MPYLSASSVIVSPTVSSNYSVSGTNTLTGCAANSVYTLMVYECADINVRLNNKPIICASPNPTNSLFEINSPSDLQIHFYNQLGQLVLQKKITAGNNILDISLLADGIYYVHTEFQNQASVFKMVKAP